MAVVSLRFSNIAVRDHLKLAASAEGSSISAVAERLIDEGLRTADHPRIHFVGPPSSRRPRVIGGQDVWVVVSTIVGGDVPADERVERAAELLTLTVADIHAAMRYYAEFTDEIDADIAARRARIDEAARLWERQQELTAS